MPAPFATDRTYRFDVPLDVLWSALADTGSYTRWFPWLDAGRLGPLEAGTIAAVVVRPPLPYRLAIDVHLDEVVPRVRIVARVTGDLVGPASLDVGAAGSTASTARLRWSLALHRRHLLLAERFARPALQVGHDAVVAIGVRRFRQAVAQIA